MSLPSERTCGTEGFGTICAFPDTALTDATIAETTRSGRLRCPKSPRHEFKSATRSTRSRICGRNRSLILSKPARRGQDGSLRRGILPEGIARPLSHFLERGGINLVVFRLVLFGLCLKNVHRRVCPRIGAFPVRRSRFRALAFSNRDLLSIFATQHFIR